MSQTSTIPVFPLNAHILPQGRMRLRIFEPRYLRMVRENVSADPAFAMAMLGTQKQGDGYDVMPRVTLVRIIDFELLEGGLLGITIEGICHAEISDIEAEDDGLRRASYRPVDNWSALEDDASHELLASSFVDMLTEYPQLAELYPDLPENDLCWYLMRWLEILPLPSEAKQSLLHNDCADQALVTVSNILQHSRDPDSSGVRI
ncbi:MAG: LON peptidase substrate-binding domain-containing protein [Candidatus Pelagadaptatus aseana]|uniref:LON peptidase substrate-binding domain-containing protein n=1 Tax=Candidatus Pelagadaptatus aseana TaxID=3120508 RepID=UPI0039B3505C